jgi:hypothetical protein
MPAKISGLPKPTNASTYASATTIMSPTHPATGSRIVTIDYERRSTQIIPKIGGLPIVVSPLWTAKQDLLPQDYLEQEVVPFYGANPDALRLRMHLHPIRVLESESLVEVVAEVDLFCIVIALGWDTLRIEGVGADEDLEALITDDAQVGHVLAILRGTREAAAATYVNLVRSPSIITVNGRQLSAFLTVTDGRFAGLLRCGRSTVTEAKSAYVATHPPKGTATAANTGPASTGRKGRGRRASAPAPPTASTMGTPIRPGTTWA